MSQYNDEYAARLQLGMPAIMAAIPPTPDPNKPGLKAGVLFRWGSLWVGAHYSGHNRRWCINLVPCITVWVTLPGGKTP